MKKLKEELSFTNLNYLIPRVYYGALREKLSEEKH